MHLSRSRVYKQRKPQQRREYKPAGLHREVHTRAASSFAPPPGNKLIFLHGCMSKHKVAR